MGAFETLHVHLALFMTISLGIGCAAVVAKIGMDANDPICFTIYRNSPAFPVLLVWSRLAEGPFRKPSTRKHWVLFLIAGLSMTVNMLGYSYGIKVSNAQLGAAWQTTVSVFVAAWAAFLGLERLTWLKCGGMLIALGGAFIICFIAEDGESGGDTTTGNFIFLLNVHGYTSFALCARILLRDFPPIFITGVTVFLTVIFALVCALVTQTSSLADKIEPNPWILSDDGRWAVAYFVLVNGIAQFAVICWGSKYLLSSTATAYSVPQPVAAGLLSLLLVRSGFELEGDDGELTEPGLELLGCIGICAGMYLIILNDHRERTTNADVTAKLEEALLLHDSSKDEAPV